MQHPSPMAYKVKGIFKGLKAFSRIFAAKEHEMEIGYPTDVKHVARIGWDSAAGGGGASPSWMKDIMASSELSSLSTFAALTGTSWPSQAAAEEQAVSCRASSSSSSSHMSSDVMKEVSSPKESKEEEKPEEKLLPPETACCWPISLMSSCGVEIRKFAMCMAQLLSSADMVDVAAWLTHEEEGALYSIVTSRPVSMKQ